MCVNAGDPSPVNVNYALQIKSVWPDTSQAAVAAKLVAGAIDYKLKLDRCVSVSSMCA